MRKGSGSDAETETCGAAKTEYISRQEWNSARSGRCFTKIVFKKSNCDKDSVITVWLATVPPVVVSNHIISVTPEWSEERNKAKDIFCNSKVLIMVAQTHNVGTCFPLIVHSIVLISWWKYFFPHNSTVWGKLWPQTWMLSFFKTTKVPVALFGRSCVKTRFAGLLGEMFGGVWVFLFSQVRLCEFRSLLSVLESHMHYWQTATS